MSRGLREPEDRARSGVAGDPGSCRVIFGPFDFDPATGELWRDGVGVPIQPQPAKVLGALLERAGSLVTREELCELVWGSRFVEADLGLNYCIRQIRRALADDAAFPVYLETLRGRGYRFQRSRRNGLRLAKPSAVRRWGWAAATLALGILSGAGVWTTARGHRTPGPGRPIILAIAPLRDLTGLTACTQLARAIGAKLKSELATADPAYVEILLDQELPPAGPTGGERFLLSGVVREEGVTRWVTFYLIRARDGRVTWNESLRTAVLTSPALPASFVQRMMLALTGEG